MFLFLRPPSSLDLAMDPQFTNIQYDKKHFIHISKSKHFMLKDSGKKVNRPRAALGFTPSDEALQEPSGVEHGGSISDED